MKLHNHLQLALVILLLTDIATFDYKACKSKKLTEGTCPKKKCMLQKCASGRNETPACEQSDCPIRMASCSVKEKPCGPCAKEKQPCQPKESTECPFCGQEMCPAQQQKPSCPPPKNGCPQEKPTGCPSQQPSCPHQKQPSCPSMKQKAQSKPTCGGQKTGCPNSKCPQPAAKPKCPPPTKPACPSEKPSCPERCSLFRNFPFPMSVKKGEPAKVVHKGKCGSNCPGGDACTGKPVK